LGTECTGGKGDVEMDSFQIGKRTFPETSEGVEEAYRFALANPSLPVILVSGRKKQELPWGIFEDLKKAIQYKSAAEKLLKELHSS
jgi:hypothetical protein